jgi:hypothetical protein
MSNFINLFQTYGTHTSFLSARDSVLKAAENSDLQSNDTGAGAYDYRANYTIGHGYGISKKSGVQNVFYEWEMCGGNITTSIGQLVQLKIEGPRRAFFCRDFLRFFATGRNHNVGGSFA